MRLRRPGRRALALGAGLSVLVAVALTGAPLSPLLPLLALWAALAHGAVRRPVPLAITAVVAMTVIDTLAAGLRSDAIVAAGVVALLCFVAGRPAARAARSRRGESGDAATDRTDGGGSPARAVADVREWTGAGGVALWSVDAEDGLARLVAAAGRKPPGAIATSGSPLAWVAASGTPMPVEPAPDWVLPSAQLAAARVAAATAPDATYLLSLELRRGAAPGNALLTCAAAVVGAALDADAARQRHAFELGRSRRVMDALHELPRSVNATQYGEQLLDTARALTGASGAVLAIWDGDEGEVIHHAGYDGGPLPGQKLETPGSEIALAARSRSTIVRDAAHAAVPQAPIACGGEAWRQRPRARAAVPIWNGGTVTGVVVVWNAAAGPLDDGGIRMLEAIARVCGAQLHALTSMGSLAIQAERDPLTGLYNRRGFERVFSRDAAQAERYGRPFAALAIDIDHFKSVNDRFGHETGDAVLRRVAAVIEATIRESDAAARFGGEEFVVILPETGLHAAREAAERLRAAVAGIASADPSIPCDIRVSVGVSSMPECVVLPSRLLPSADEALYGAKRAGRDQVAVAGAWVEKRPEFR
jgi:diguanylate cyclase (GGDEF)-like protein